MSEYTDDIAKYTSNVNEAAVSGIVKHLGIALRSNDSSLVAASDPAELERVREGFLKKKLARSESDAELDAAIGKVVDAMKAERNKSRVTFYYLLAEHYSQLGDFA